MHLSITEILNGPQEVLTNHRKDVDRLLDQIDKNNPLIFRAILNPAPLRNQECPTSWSHGTPSEAWTTLDNVGQLSALFYAGAWGNAMAWEKVWQQTSYNYKIEKEYYM